MRRCGAFALLVMLAVATLLPASFGFAQDSKSSATIEQFRQYGELMVGRWATEITLTDDIPGFGKKGDKMSGHATHKWIADGTALEGEWFVGAVAGKWIAFWDGGSKQIRIVGVDSTGAVGESVLTKVNDKWIEKARSVFPDGKKMVATITRTFADTGNTQNADWTDQVFEGKKILDERDVWTRLAK